MLKTHTEETVFLAYYRWLDDRERAWIRREIIWLTNTAANDNHN